MNEKMDLSLTSVADPVAHIAPKKRKDALKAAVLTRVTLSLVLALGVAAGLMALSIVAANKDHMGTHARTVAPGHMDSLAMRVGNSELSAHMGG